MERRFQPVTVAEPSLSDTEEMLSGIKEYYEKYHRVQVPPEMIHPHGCAGGTVYQRPLPAGQGH